MKKILVVDDDKSIGSMLEEYFTKHEFEVTVIGTFAEAQRYLTYELPDILLLDRNLGEEDGLNVVRILAHHSDIPVIVMSGARMNEADKVEGLEIGARDYVLKPFSLRELLARVRAALRPVVQRNLPTPKIFIFDGWRLSIKNRRLLDPDGLEVKLTTSEFNLLVAMLEGAGEVLSRERLLRATRIHDQEIVDRSIDVTVLRIRRKLLRGSAGHDYIKTHRGAGYRFDHTVAVETTAKPLR